MAPSSKAERGGPGGKRGAAGGAGPGAAPRGRREHLVRQLERVRLSGQLSPRLFRKLPPRVCVTLKSIVDEEFLWAGHIFLGFSKCGRYVLSYTSSSGDDDFSFYLYHLYWWEFNVHSKLRLPPPGAPQTPDLPPAAPSPAVAKAKEFVADLFRRAQGAGGGPGGAHGEGGDDPPSSPRGLPPETPPTVPGSPPGEPHPPGTSPEPGYVNYTKLRYVLEPGEPPEELEDDKISLPFVVTDLSGRSLRPLRDRATAQGQYLTVEQLTLDFEYVINEVIRNDAAWSRQFCSFSDYDIVILEVCPETNQVVINIGLLLLAFPSPDEEGQLRPRTYHTSLKVAWDLNNGTFTTVGVGDLTEVKGQTSGSVWSSYRKGCVDTVMRWLVPEGPGRGVHRMTNEALHKGCSLKVLADNERYTWIVL
uniref:DDB1 and CUL4 associated factor 15 n=1 Tax=Cyanoderma ruficeps TaxID=181631 RepID=A0A8C3QSS5_9PASS